MAKAATHDFEAIGRAVVLIASLFGGAAAAPQAVASTPQSTPSADASPSTPEAPKDEPKAAPEGNAGKLSAADFAKANVGYAAHCKDNGVALKALWAELELKDADGKPVERAGAISEKDYDRVLAAIEAAKLA